MKFFTRKIRIKDFEKLKFLLNLEIAKSNEGINICQCKYTSMLLRNSGFLYYKLTSTPMVSFVKLVKEDDSPRVDFTTDR